MNEKKLSENQQSFFQKHYKLLVIPTIAIASLAVYAQTINFDFINIDDRAYIYENRLVLSGFNWNSLRWAFTVFYSGNWHPLTWLSHILDFSLFGLNAGGHHAVNVVFHTINSILAFVVFRKMTGDFWKSAIVAFLFTLHPAHVESVAWVAERKDVLSTMFWLLTMWSYLCWNERGSKISSLYYVATILLFALGLMSKPMLVTLPFVLLLCDFWALERLKKLRDLVPLIIEKLPLFAVTIMSSVITFLAQKSGGAVVSLEYIPFATRLANVCLSYAKYVVMLFYPANLGFWYPFEPNKNPPEIIGAMILLLVISSFCWRERKKRKYLLMGWLWFLGTLVPVIGLVQIGMQNLADRYTYIPYFGLFVMVVWGAGDLFAHFRLDKKIVFAAWFIALLIFGALAYKQTSFWQTSETIYTRSLGLTKNNYFIMTNLCLHHLAKSPPEIAEARCTELLEQTPPSPEGNNILGFLRTETGKYDQAVKNYHAAIRMRPDWGIVYANLSETLARQGKPDEAENYLQKAFLIKDVSLNNEILARSSNNLASVYMQKNRTEKAIQYFNKALELKPDFAEARENLKKAAATTALSNSTH